MTNLPARVAETILRYNMLDPGARVGVAVSGGADSVALLAILHRLAAASGWRLRVLHLNHHLRGAESDADEEFVRRLASRLGLPFTVAHADSSAWRGNLEQQARDARRRFFAEARVEHQLQRVALGHTRDDQAETVLLRLLRGSGARGLAGILPVTPDGLVRPLIALTRQELERFLMAEGFTWREDSSNRSPRFARNRIRLELLPLLARQWNPEIAAVLARTAELAREDEDWWQSEVERVMPSLGQSDGAGLIVDIPGILALPPPLARRLVRHAITRVRGDLRRIDFAHVDQILRLIRRSGGGGRLRLPGLEVCRSFDQIRFAPPGEDPRYSFPVSMPGEWSIPGLPLRLRIWREGPPPAPGSVMRASSSGDSGYNTNGAGCALLDAGRVSGELEIRNWRPGDGYRPANKASVLKLHDLFQIGRIPLWTRRRWPVLTAGGRVVWARGFGPAADVAPGPRSQALIRIEEAGGDPAAWFSGGR